MKTELEQIAIDLAEWSKKYPRVIIYNPNTSHEIQDELIALEERAKEAVLKLESESPRPVEDGKPYWVIELKNERGINYYNVMDGNFHDNIHNATKFNSRENAIEIDLDFRVSGCYVTEHMDV